MNSLWEMKVWIYRTVKGAEGKAGRWGCRGGRPAVETGEERWMGDVWNVGTLPRGVLGRKHYSPDSPPSFK